MTSAEIIKRLNFELDSFNRDLTKAVIWTVNVYHFQQPQVNLSINKDANIEFYSKDSGNRYWVFNEEKFNQALFLYNLKVQDIEELELKMQNVIEDIDISYRGEGFFYSNLEGDNE